MAEQELTEQDIPNAVYQQALDLYQNGKSPPDLPAPYRDYLRVITARQDKNLGVQAVLTTLLVKKLHTPTQDIRLHQANMEGGFSARGLDKRVVTPFLRQQQFPYMKSGAGPLTRSLEQPIPYDLNYPGRITPKGVKQAFLGLVDGVQCQGLPAKSVLLGIFAGLIRFRDRNTNLVLSRPVNLSVEQVVDKVSRHHSLNIAGVARLPVLAVHAILTILVRELSRYNGCDILPLEHHNTADTRTNLIGDAHIVDGNNRLFEGYEVKHDIPISSSLIRDSFDKLRTTPVQRFYILTTYRHDSYAEFEPDIQQVAQSHGCQLIVNGVDPTLRYYLRLIGSTHEFVDAYVTNLETDPSVTYQLKEAWNDIVAS